MLQWTLGCIYLFQLRIFSAYLPKSEIAGSFGGSIFNFLRNLYIIRHIGCTNLHSYQQCRRVPFSPHPVQYSLFVNYSVMAILTNVIWYNSPIVVFICISLIINDVEHFFCAFWASVSISLIHRNVYLDLLIFWLRFVFWDWASWAVYIFWRLIPYESDYLEIFSSIMWVVFSSCLRFPLLCKSF